MDPEDSLPHSQQPATCPYPEADQSNPCLPIPLLDNFKIIPPSTSGSSKWSLSNQVSPPKSCMHFSFSPHTCYMLRPTYFLDFISRIFVSTDPRAPHYVVFSNPVTSSVLGPNVFLRTLFSKTLSLRSSLNVSDQVQHPYKQQAKLYYCILKIQKTPTSSFQGRRVIC